MDKIATENLFLLEFLVDKVQLDPCLTRDMGDMMGNTCVSVQFLDNAPLDICEDDFTPKRQYNNDSGNLKSGKSCLFSLSPAQAEEAVTQFDLYVSIFRKTQPGILPDKVQVGNSLISIVNLFNELVQCVNTSTGQSPTAKTLKDTFKISNEAGQYIGDIGIYIRMSCFGKLIVTQFQMNLDDKSVLFKDKEGHSLYRYKKAGTGSRRNSLGGNGGGGGGGADCCLQWNQAGGRNTDYPRVPCARERISEQSMSRNGECPNVPCEINRTLSSSPPPPRFDIPCNECEMEQQRLLQERQQPSQQLTEVPGCYQEIGAQMGGNALTIRVHKDANKLEQIDEDEEDCTCSPGNVGGNVGKKRRSKMSNANTAGTAGTTASCLCPTTGEQAFSMRPGCNDSSVSNQPFSFKMGGCGLAAQNNVTVVPPVCTAADGTQYTELSDPNRDVFILRIGKKSEGVEKKQNLELELCTPKGPETKPPPKKETRDTQWADDDAAEAGGGKAKKGEKGGDGGKGGKKGKGGKGGKGKKGKK